MNNNLSEEWIIENVVNKKYLDFLQNTYRDKDLITLLNLNIELRMLYLKHTLMIENLLKNILIYKIFNIEEHNKKSDKVYDAFHLNNFKKAKQLIRSGYIKYGRSGILKHKSIRNLIDVMSFEWIMKLLEVLSNDTLKRLALYFGIEEANRDDILLAQLFNIKDVRNYLAHNLRVLGINFSIKHDKNYQYQLEATNDLHYVNLILHRFSLRTQLLQPFINEYCELFDKYQVNCKTNLTENHYNESIGHQSYQRES